MKLYYAQTTEGKEICITEQFYEYLKTKNKPYKNGKTTINYTQFKEK